MASCSETNEIIRKQLIDGVKALGPEFIDEFNKASINAWPTKEEMLKARKAVKNENDRGQ